MLELTRRALLLLAVSVVLYPVAGTAQTPLTSELVADLPGEDPVIVTHAPGDFARVFIGTLDGRVFILTGGAVLPTPFLPERERKSTWESSSTRSRGPVA